MLPLEPDVISPLDPGHLLLLVSLLRVYVGLHAPGVETLVFLEVAYVDLVLQQLLPASDLEVEPLQVASRVAIDPHEAVVLALCYFDDAVEVAALEEGIEEELVLGLPVLSAEGPVREFHVVWSLDVVIGKGEGPVIPCVVGVLEPWTQVDDLGSRFGVA